MIERMVMKMRCQLFVGLLIALSVLTRETATVMRDAKPENKLRDREFVLDAEHIQEHVGKAIFDPKKSTTQEIEWHFFKLHDTNNDRRLDGLELYKAIEHGLEQELNDGKELEKDDNAKREFMAKLMIYVSESVDLILKQDDRDGDGYLNYYEFKIGRYSSPLLNLGDDDDDQHS